MNLQIARMEIRPIGGVAAKRLAGPIGATGISPFYIQNCFGTVTLRTEAHTGE